MKFPYLSRELSNLYFKVAPDKETDLSLYYRMRATQNQSKTRWTLMLRLDTKFNHYLYGTARNASYRSK